MKPKYYTGNIQPGPDIIFVFGSNPEGRHGLGTAKIARNQFGAIYGCGEGLMGNSYAIPTKDLRFYTQPSISPDHIIASIQKMYDTARANPDKKFMVAYRNVGPAKSLNGYTGDEMMDMFMQAGSIPSNVYFSYEWVSSGRLEL